MKSLQVIIFTFVILFVIIPGAMYIMPTYKVWKKEMDGRAKFAEAEQDRQILIEEAKARLEAEKLNAKSEVERAKGMAEAMQIENGQLTEVYNQYLFIRSLQQLAADGNLPQIIYVPNDMLVPTLDMGDKGKMKKIAQ